MERQHDLNSRPDAVWEADVVVLGSGVGGLTAAVTAALEGLRVIVLEHQAVVGGTSARSSGTVWVPDNHLMRQCGVSGDDRAAATYLGSLVGEDVDPRNWRVFLAKAPDMLRDLEQRAGLRFRPFMSAPDYRQDHPGAAPGGRALEPMAFDGGDLGSDFERLAWPIPELMVLGGMMVTRAEAARLIRADRDPGGFLLGAKLVFRYAVDRLRSKRGRRLVLGNALVATLWKALKDNGGEVVTEAQTQRLVRRNGRVSGVVVQHAGKTIALEAARGIVLAGGGFPASPGKRAEHLLHPVPNHTPAGPGCIGRTIDLGLEAGAALGPSGKDNALWFPSSVATRKDGTTAVYPHIVLDRSKPGLIAVNSLGKRFTNEAVSYHEFVRNMYAATTAEQSAVPAWLVVDRGFIAKYGLGLIRPRTPSLKRYVKSGYLMEGRSLAELAAHIGVPAAALEQTVARYNRFAETGVDEDFGKGETIYDRSNGDPAIPSNPCIGPIQHGPFYAMAVWPTPLGISRGLLANRNAQAVDADGIAIAGLYVCGNDMQSAFGGQYPGAGAQLGQAMTFGWTAGRHLAGIETPSEDTAPDTESRIKTPQETV
ncbi:FAD-dependent oxidoreductase [Roseibium sp.]|uniref:FAD-dependent oxidoreductase n=1 Tax=Roseibium sp. TaxID=1936156 RepID=UPI003A96A791